MLLQLESVRKTYQVNGSAIGALNDVSLDVEAGRFIALRGKSGCGKSTLLLAAGGLLRPDQGRVSIEGQDVYSIAPNDRAQLRASMIGFVFQQFHLVPYLSVLNNVMSATLGGPHEHAASIRHRAMELLERFGLKDRARHRPGQLSTGERQRTALARALLNKPSILLADEPTGNLDEENAGIVLEHLQQFASGGGAVLLATHDDRATASADSVIAMHDGQFEVR